MTTEEAYERITAHFQQIGELIGEQVTTEKTARTGKEKKAYEAEVKRCLSELEKQNIATAFWIQRILIAGK